MPPASPIVRSKALDVLRGLAVLLVIVTHSGAITNEEIHGAKIPMIPGMAEVQNSERTLFTRMFAKIQLMSWTGVDMFFVLSGFLIGGLLLNELEKTGKINFPHFWVRRAFKIIPSYYFLLLVLAVTGTTHYLSEPRSGSFTESLMIHGLFLQNYLDRLVNEVTWSLAIEEHFYLLLPALLIGIAYCNRRWGRDNFRGIRTLIIGSVLFFLGLRICAVLFGFHNEIDWMVSHYRLDSLLLGVFCQYLWRTRRGAIRRWAAKPLIWLVLGAVLVSPSLFLLRGNPVMFSLGFFSIACGFAIILMAVIGRGLGRWENNWAASGLAAVGRWSYNIYLWHFFLPMLLYHLGITFYAELQADLTEQITWVPLAIVLKVSLYAVLAIAGGFLATKIVEEPFLWLRDRWVPRRSRVSPLGDKAKA